MKDPKKIQREALEAKRRYEQHYGRVEDEPGIEEADFLPGATDEAPIGPTGEKLKMGSAPAWYQVGPTGMRSKASEFADFIRGKASPGQKASSAIKSLRKKMPEAPTIKKSYNYDAELVKELQDQMHHYSSLGTKAGDDRAKEILEEIRKLRDPRRVD